MGDTYLDENGNPIGEAYLDENGEPLKAAPKKASAAPQKPSLAPLDRPLPEIGPLAGIVPPLQLYNTAAEFGMTGRDVIRTGPMVGAGLATLATPITGGASLPVAMGIAGLGGAGGSFLSQGAEALLGGEAAATPGAVLKEGGAQGALMAAMEPVGALAGGALKLAGGTLMKAGKPVASAAGRLAEQLGLAPKLKGIPRYLVEHTILGKKIAQASAETGIDKAAIALAEQAKVLGVPPPPPDLPASELAAWTRTMLKQSSENQASRNAIFKALEQERVTAARAAEAARQGSYREFGKQQAATFAAATRQGVEAGKLGITQQAAAAKTAAEAQAQMTAALGKRAAENVRMKLAGEVDQELLGIGANMEPEHVGTAIQGAIKRGAKIGEINGRSLYEAADAALQEATVPASQALKDAVQGIKARMGANPALKDPVLRDVISRLTGNKAKGKLGLLDLETMPYVQIRELQRAVASRLPGFGSTAAELSAPEAKGLVKFLWRNLTDAMEEGTAGTQGGEALKIANDYWRGYSGVMKRGFVPQVVKKYPEQVVGLLKDGDVTKVRLLREAVLGYAERYGSPAEATEAREAWDALRSNFLRQRLFKGGPEKLADNLDVVGSPVVRELFDTGPLPGMTRLYRGQPGFTPEYVKRSKTVQGRWFTPDKMNAAGYAEPYAGSSYGGAVVQVDVPQTALQGLQRNTYDRSGFSMGPLAEAGREFIVPRAVANAAQRVPSTQVLSNLRQIGTTLRELGPRLEKLLASSEGRAASEVAAASAQKAERLATLRAGIPPAPVQPPLPRAPIAPAQAPPPPPPALLAAQQQTGLLGEALKGSQAAQTMSTGVGGISLGHAAYLGPVAHAMHVFGRGMLYMMPSEMLGGLIAAAVYNPARTRALTAALSLMGRNGTAGVARLAALEAEWSGRTPAKKKPPYFPALAPPPKPPMIEIPGATTP